MALKLASRNKHEYETEPHGRYQANEMCSLGQVKNRWINLLEHTIIQIEVLEEDWLCGFRFICVELEFEQFPITYLVREEHPVCKS